MDTGSNDRTKEIVEEYTNRIFDFSGLTIFQPHGISHSNKQQWIMFSGSMRMMYLQLEDQEKFKLLKQSLQPTIDAVSMNYHLSFDHEGNVTSLLRRYRLVKKVNEFKWIGAVHEFLSVSGNLYDSDVAVTHSPLSHDSRT